jgi:hypothetical protein
VIFVTIFTHELLEQFSKGHAEDARNATGCSAEHIALQMTTNGHLESLLSLFKNGKNETQIVSFQPRH